MKNKCFSFCWCLNRAKNKGKFKSSINKNITKALKSAEDPKNYLDKNNRLDGNNLNNNFDKEISEVKVFNEQKKGAIINPNELGKSFYDNNQVKSSPEYNSSFLKKHFIYDKSCLIL